ncbi:MAG TPA: thioredoxin domain-containing protein [Polyangiales bacterium]
MNLLSKWLGITPKKQPFHLDDTNFEAEVLASKLPVLVDVWGASCGPCKQLEPIIMDLAAHYDGRVKVCELSAAASPRVSALLRVQHTPTVIYFLDGVELERIPGFRSSLFHKQTIQEHFGVEP